MKKVYVLDTNVLLTDPNSILSFEDNVVVLPTTVLEEVDSIKKNMDEVGRNARYVSKLIDNLRSNGSLQKGVELENGGLLKVVTPPEYSTVYFGYGKDSNDNRIIATALELNSTMDVPVILVTKDVSLRVKADGVGVSAQDYLSDKVLSPSDEYYQGFREMVVDSDFITEIYTKKSVELPENFRSLYENEFVILTSPVGGSVIARRKGKKLEKTFVDNSDSYFGVYPRNARQIMAAELLLDDKVPLVTIMGKAGTGKTLLAMAIGLFKVLDEKKFAKILCYRPIVSMGNDLGFLPGELEEKLDPWIQPLYDTLEFIFNVKGGRKSLDDILVGMQGQLEIGALSYIRGRSIPEQFIIVDEAQNLTKHEVKTILTRVGKNSKIVLIGDPDQIDHPFLDPYSNGLTYVSEKMKDQSIAGHIYLSKGERSTLAEICADIL